MTKNTFADAWDKSYKRGDNFLFYPNEEIIRFANLYLKKRISITGYKPIGKAKRSLDIGCGIGRHVWYLDEMGIETYGIDISRVAIELAKKTACQIHKEHLVKRFMVMSGVAVKFRDAFFDVIVSHGTLDSMRFTMAKKTVSEAERVISNNGYMYMDLISGDDSYHAREFNDEVIVKNDHERNTVQSFFNYGKILALIKGTQFKPISIKLRKDEDVLSGVCNSRWYCVLKKAQKHSH